MCANLDPENSSNRKLLIDISFTFQSAIITSKTDGNRVARHKIKLTNSTNLHRNLFVFIKAHWFLFFRNVYCLNSAK